jgi:hypothetical protein
LGNLSEGVGLALIILESAGGVEGEAIAVEC